MLKTDKQQEKAMAKAKDGDVTVADEKEYAMVGQGPWYIMANSLENPGMREVVLSGANMADGWKVLDSMRDDPKWEERHPAMWTPAMALAHMRRHENRTLAMLLDRAEISRVFAEEAAEADDDHVVVMGGLAIGVVGGLQSTHELSYLNRLVKSYAPSANALAKHGLVEPANAVRSVNPSALAAVL